MVLDLEAIRRRLVTGWGDRMTVGIEVSILRQLLDELTVRRLEIDALSERVREAEARAASAEERLTQYLASFDHH